MDLDVASEHPDFPQRRLVQRVLARFDARTQSIAVGVLVDEGARGSGRRTGHLAKDGIAQLARFLENARKYLERSAA